MKASETKILIVDDEPTVIAMFSVWLRKQELTCYSADSVVEAMAILKEHHVDLVITDIFMPGATGVDLLKWCKQTEREIPFIFITGTLDAEFVTQALNLGAKHLLPKPVTRNELVELVQEQIALIETDEKKREDDNQIKSELSDVRKKYIDEVAEKEVLFMAVIDSLAQAVSARDSYTHNHNRSVADYAVKVGMAMGLEEDVLTKLHIAGRLHDIGKIGVPEAILQKNGPLTDEEYDMMKQHPAVGSDILRTLPNFEDILDIVLYHHERYDGYGYPRGLVGEDIPLLARITAVCDAWDAMTSDRVYRKKLPVKEARKRIIEGAGTQLDAKVVKVFLTVIE
ncbi:MAG: response regulator [Kiritimatiellae bacterium]|jgi:putative two-component system response regulator|nr:response regulator [Kiritimatiellia bacterium]